MNAEGGPWLRLLACVGVVFILASCGEDRGDQRAGDVEALLYPSGAELEANLNLIEEEVECAESVRGAYNELWIDHQEDFFERYDIPEIPQ